MIAPIQTKAQEATEQPSFIVPRLELFEQRCLEYADFTRGQPREVIEIVYIPNNGRPHRNLVGKSWVTTPSSVAKQVSIRSQFDKWLVARVDGQLWDLIRPLEKSCTVELIEFDHEDGKRVFWTSAAFVLGSAAERHFGGLLSTSTIGEDGFAQEWSAPTTITKADYKPLHRLSHRTINQRTKFERVELNRCDLLAMFDYNKYKLHEIKEMPEDAVRTVYRCGSYVDISDVPLLPDTTKLVAFELIKNSSSYFLGDATQDSLQRMYGISFPTKERYEKHHKWLEEAAKRDHRKVGREQELFFQSPLSAGSAFFLPHGQTIYNTLMSYVREEYWKRDYQEVSTPNMFNSDLWKTSGHWQHYRDDMFTFEVEKADWALKPMNCPAHCVLFGHRERTYRELPLRISEFGILHRNEASGALSGMTRVRKFVQDDTHIFCMEGQVEQEVTDVLEWLKYVYNTMFGFSFKVKLSTMPDDHLGDIATWERAESQLTKALDGLMKSTGVPWELNPGDGAFYGPKIDIAICDALKREHQCASIQLDFQLPQQFNLEYRTDGIARSNTSHSETLQPVPKCSANSSKDSDVSTNDSAHDSVVSSEILVPHDTTDASTARDSPQDMSTVVQMSEKNTATKSRVDPLTQHRKALTPGCARPVMIHRGIFGSFERFIAILCEHLEGKWPFWLSPRQILVLPVGPFANDYATEVKRQFRRQGMHADVDLSPNALSKKVRTGQMKSYNFVFVVGAAEIAAHSINVRNRDDPGTHKRGDLVPINSALNVLAALKEERRLSGLVEFETCSSQ